MTLYFFPEAVIVIFLSAYDAFILSSHFFAFSIADVLEIIPFTYYEITGYVQLIKCFALNIFLSGFCVNFPVEVEMAEMSESPGKRKLDPNIGDRRQSPEKY